MPQAFTWTIGLRSFFKTVKLSFVCRNCPISYEPSGTDFLSPCIQVPFLISLFSVSFVSHWLQATATGSQSWLSDRRRILWPGCLKTTLFSGPVQTFLNWVCKVLILKQPVFLIWNNFDLSKLKRTLTFQGMASHFPASALWPRFWSAAWSGETWNTNSLVSNV